jgi:hypothetical protein
MPVPDQLPEAESSQKILYVQIGAKMRTLELEPWYGELGWEVMSWVPTCRKRALDYDRVIASSFAGMAPLYADFAEFRAHDESGRRLDYPKMYHPDGIYHRYGRPGCSEIAQEILIHARGITRKNSINYRQWAEVVEQLNTPLAFIGAESDMCLPGCFDFRSIELQRLMDMITRARLVVGVSSGIMHLAAACGTDLVVWGDRRTYFGETLERRYKMTWNPFNVKVGWIDAENWHPEPEEIIKKIEQML